MELRETLKPLVQQQVESVNKEINATDAKIERLARSEYPETRLLQHMSGVGILIDIFLNVRRPETILEASSEVYELLRNSHAALRIPRWGCPFEIEETNWRRSEPLH
ncbi:MAG: hypothetical protein M3Y07_01415 [Acidobacteriota bacterium]|nr:hypothetical protein [Acidobacteriota bacterium]